MFENPGQEIILMDTSKEYVEMCAKAEEIQDVMRPLTNHLLLAGAPTDINGIIFGIRSHDFYGYTWLPRQDQLQEMLIPRPYYSMLNLLSFFNDYVWSFTDYDDLKAEENYPFKSMEQLWLAFVMKEKYNKIWSNGEWINGD
jgi:hypothetical protein